MCYPTVASACPTQAAGGSMASQLFSTAVISGSSSVPNIHSGGGGGLESKSLYSILKKDRQNLKLDKFVHSSP